MDDNKITLSSHCGTQNGTFWVGDFPSDHIAIDYHQTFIPIIREYYPQYTMYWTESKTDKAFKIVQKFMDMKIIDVRNVKQFIEAVNAVAEVL